MLDSFLKLAWKDISSGGHSAIEALLILIIVLLTMGMKKVWDAKTRSEDELKNERERYNMLNSQLIESRDKMLDRYSNDTGIVAKALGEVEKSLSHINGVLSRR